MIVLTTHVATGSYLDVRLKIDNTEIDLGLFDKREATDLLNNLQEIVCCLKDDVERLR